MNDRLLTIGECQEYLCTSPKKLLYLLETYDIPKIYLGLGRGGGYRYRLSDVQTLIKRLAENAKKRCASKVGHTPKPKSIFTKTSAEFINSITSQVESMSKNMLPAVLAGLYVINYGHT